MLCFLLKRRLQNLVPISPSPSAPPCNESEVHRVFFWSQVLVQSAASIVAYDQASYAVLYMEQCTASYLGMEIGEWSKCPITDGSISP